MQRRTFLGSVAAAVGGLLAWRPSVARPQFGAYLFKIREAALRRRTKWSPPPRWEWEVSPWHVDREQIVRPDAMGLACIRSRFGLATVRDWVAEATVSGDELNRIYEAIGCVHRHDSDFCHVASGQMHIHSMAYQYLGRGLCDCFVTLRESQARLADSRGDKRQGLNFHDIFRGGHAVVSVDEKETV